jgi:methyltransferase (TIGR00027 family)
LATTQVFEVDHPATQVIKQRVIKRLGLKSDHVTYVGVDLESDDMVARLCAAGFESLSPSLWLWEGVTQYLTHQAVDATLEVVRDLSAPGSAIVLTYIDSRALGEQSPFPESRRWTKAVERAGEPWRFGLLPTNAEAFFADRGFRLRRDISTSTSDTGQSPEPRRLQGSALYRVALAELETT